MGAAEGVRVMEPAPSTLSEEFVPIDLPTVLRLTDAQNPEILLARQIVVEATALRQLAAAQFLPSLNAGANYDNHTGALQQSNGNILSLNRAAVYVGAGANAVAAGTVNIPGVFLAGNVADVVYNYLQARQIVQARDFGAVAVRNQAYLEATLAYSELLRAEGQRAIDMQVRRNARELARLTANYAAKGLGRDADADRAATELARREADFQFAEGQVNVASARLCRVLNLDPSIRLHPTDAWVIPIEIVPTPMPLAELVALGITQRPELGERRAIIRQTLLSLENQRILPFSPTVLLGFSAGGFGGGSNLVSPVFGAFGSRSDFDAIGYWTLKNFGVGNLASINVARARNQFANYEWIAVMDRVRAEVASSYARMHARYSQIATLESAVKSAFQGFAADFRLAETGGRGVRPIEVLNSIQLLARSQTEYLDAIVDYNEAQFSTYVAVGQPPPDRLSRPVPTAGVVPPGDRMPTPNDPLIPPAAPPAAPGAPAATASAASRTRDPAATRTTRTSAAHARSSVSLDTPLRAGVSGAMSNAR